MGDNKLLKEGPKPKVVEGKPNGKKAEEDMTEDLADLTLFGITLPRNKWLRSLVPHEKPLSAEDEEVRRLLLEDLGEGDTRCGVGPIKFDWLQPFARKEFYLIAFCLVSITNGMFFTYTVSILSTIEKRFKLTSKQTGITLTGNDISQVILGTFLGYYANLGHRPRWMGAGVIISAVASFLAALPHFMYGSGQDAMELVNSTVFQVAQNITSKKKVELCHLVPEEECGEGYTEGRNIVPVFFLFFSQFFVGISCVIFWSVGVTYLDDNVNKKTYPIFYAISMLLRIVGPVLGFLTGAKALGTWIDPSYSPNLSQRDPRWLGAWWLGYVIISATLFFTGFILFFFPRVLPETVTRQARRIVERARKDAETGRNRGIKHFLELNRQKKVAERPSINNFLQALRRLFTNKLWMGNLFNTCLVVLGYSCYWSFKPKYLENQFRKSAAEANYYTGVASLASVSMGTFLGGAIMRWLRPGSKFVTGYQIFITLFVAAGFTGLTFIGCPQLEIVGPISGNEAPLCSSECGCSNKFSPMCDENMATFYSPCYAGCTTANISVSPISFEGCSCVAPVTSSVDNLSLPQRGGLGTAGYCPEECESFIWYLVTQVVMKTVSATARVSSSIITLRSVAEEDKGVALGALTAFLSCFGLIPGPIIMGAIIDSTCVLWNTSCGERGNCWLYDSYSFRLAMHLVPAVFVLLSVLGDFVVYYYSYLLDLYGDKEEEDDDKEAGEDDPLNNQTKNDLQGQEEGDLEVKEGQKQEEEEETHIKGMCDPALDGP